jgi:hypothetical protein
VLSNKMDINATCRPVGPTSIVGPWIWNLSVESQHLRAIITARLVWAIRLAQVINWALGQQPMYLTLSAQDVKRMGNGTGLSSTCDHTLRIQTIYY